MKTQTYLLIFFVLLFVGRVDAQQRCDVLTKDDLKFLNDITEDVIESSKIYPLQEAPDNMGKNNSGGVLIRPGGRDCYPSFWIRDYAMALDCGKISAADQRLMLELTASWQADKSWITKRGGMVPLGAIADHIRIDDLQPIYYPGTYSYEDQGDPIWGVVPPYSDNFFFIYMVYHGLKSGAIAIGDLGKEIAGVALTERMERAFASVPSQSDSHIVYTTEALRGVDFGFRDVVTFTGELALPTIFKYRAAIYMAQIYNMMGLADRASNYREVASEIKKNFTSIFLRDNMVKASSSIGGQSDVWSSVLAVYYGLLSDEDALAVCNRLSEAYSSGDLSYRDNIRHVLSCDDYSSDSAWERSLASKDEYQNGSYWGTPTGWVCYAINRVSKDKARQLAKEYVDELRENDYRKGADYGAPYECFNKRGSRQNPVYMT